jgi:hypothetical protein
VTIALFAGGFAIGALPFTIALIVLVGVATAAWWVTRDDASDGEVDVAGSGDGPLQEPTDGEGGSLPADSGDGPTTSSDGDAPSPTSSGGDQD